MPRTVASPSIVASRTFSSNAALAGRKFLGPVIATPGINRHSAFSDMDLGAVTVAFDFVNPVIPGGNTFLQDWIAWIDKPWHGARPPPGKHPARAETALSHYVFMASQRGRTIAGPLVGLLPGTSRSASSIEVGAHGSRLHLRAYRMA